MTHELTTATLAVHARRGLMMVKGDGRAACIMLAVYANVHIGTETWCASMNQFLTVTPCYRDYTPTMQKFSTILQNQG